MRGLAHLARLIAEPGREIHAADLAGTASSADVGDAGAQLDPHARAEYEERLRELREEREEAERLHDRGRFERCSQEIEWLAGELSRGFGLGGRERRAGAASERARQSVTRAIKYAIDKIEPHEAGLADHLRRNVRTGTFCSYAPADRDRVTWTL
jgi:non-specific serine/threonine protein kinase